MTQSIQTRPRTARTLRNDARRLYDALEPVFALGAFVSTAALLLTVVAP